MMKLTKQKYGMKADSNNKDRPTRTQDATEAVK